MQDFTRDWRDRLDPSHLDTRELGRLLRSRRGMTLVEVMVVIVIILTLMGVLAFGVFSMLGDAQGDATRVMITKTSQNLKLQALRGKKLKSGSMSEYFPEGAPQDAWGNELKLIVPGPNGQKFELVSYGADGQEGGTGADADIKLSEMGR